MPRSPLSALIVAPMSTVRFGDYVMGGLRCRWGLTSVQARAAWSQSIDAAVAAVGAYRRTDEHGAIR